MHRKQTYHSDINMTADERDQKVVELKALGRSYREIGAATGLSANGVMHALRRIAEGRPGRVRS
jgi:DNA-directed RNA polymerase specialized sigma24 family protein